ncbi:hypothetical protein ACJX0J_015233, partial [Zea mays]
MIYIYSYTGFLYVTMFTTREEKRTVKVEALPYDAINSQEAQATSHKKWGYKLGVGSEHLLEAKMTRHGIKEGDQGF